MSDLLPSHFLDLPAKRVPVILDWTTGLDYCMDWTGRVVCCITLAYKIVVGSPFLWS